MSSVPRCQSTNTEELPLVQNRSICIEINYHCYYSPHFTDNFLRIFKIPLGCWLSRTFFIFSPHSIQEYNDFWHVLRMVGFILSFANSCTNPVALYCVSGAFRKHFNRWANRKQLLELALAPESDRSGAIIITSPTIHKNYMRFLISINVSISSRPFMLMWRKYFIKRMHKSFRFLHMSDCFEPPAHQV